MYFAAGDNTSLAEVKLRGQVCAVTVCWCPLCCAAAVVILCRFVVDVGLPNDRHLHDVPGELVSHPVQGPASGTPCDWTLSYRAETIESCTLESCGVENGFIYVCCVFLLPTLCSDLVGPEDEVQLDRAEDYAV